MPVYIEKVEIWSDVTIAGWTMTERTRKDRATQPLDHGRLRWAIKRALCDKNTNEQLIYYIEWITNKRFIRRLKCSVKEGVGLCGIRQVRWTDSATPQGEKPLSLLVHLWDKPSPPSDVQSLANALTLYAWEMFEDGVMQIHFTNYTSEEWGREESWVCLKSSDLLGVPESPWDSLPQSVKPFSFQTTNSRATLFRNLKCDFKIQNSPYNKY